MRWKETRGSNDGSGNEARVFPDSLVVGRLAKLRQAVIRLTSLSHPFIPLSRPDRAFELAPGVCWPAMDRRYSPAEALTMIEFWFGSGRHPGWRRLARLTLLVDEPIEVHLTDWLSPGWVRTLIRIANTSSSGIQGAIEALQEAVAWCQKAEVDGLMRLESTLRDQERDLLWLTGMTLPEGGLTFEKMRELKHRICLAIQDFLDRFLEEARPHASRIPRTRIVGRIFLNPERLAYARKPYQAFEVDIGFGATVAFKNPESLVISLLEEARGEPARIRATLQRLQGVFGI